MKRKIFAILLALCMVMALLPAAALAADYEDTEGHWAESAIDRWSDVGVVHGEGDGDFHPEDNMTRAEAAQVMVNLLRLKDEADLTGFTDVEAGQWYVEPIAKCVAADILHGDGATTMSPEGTLSREMMFVMIGRALGIEEAETSDKDFADGADTSDWAAGYINALVNMGVINGVDDNHIAPLSDINRASVMTALDRLIGGYANEDGQTVEIVPGKVTLIVADNVAVTGEADPKVPIIVAGDTTKVDMKGVKGKAVVQVNVSDVAIKNAPAGTEIKAAEGVEGVTVNGHKMKDAEDYTVPAPSPSYTPSDPEPDPDPEEKTYNVTVGDHPEGVTVNVDKTKAKKGEPVTVTVTVPEGTQVNVTAKNDSTNEPIQVTKGTTTTTPGTGTTNPGTGTTTPGTGTTTTGTGATTPGTGGTTSGTGGTTPGTGGPTGDNNPSTGTTTTTYTFVMPAANVTVTVTEATTAA